MKIYFILLLTLLIYGCDQNNKNNTTNKTRQEVTVVAQYPGSKLIESNDTNEYKKYVYHTVDEFGEILTFYYDLYGDPIDSNYEDETIKHTYETNGTKIAIKLTYLTDVITQIDIWKYN